MYGRRNPKIPQMTPTNYGGFNLTRETKHEREAKGPTDVTTKDISLSSLYMDPDDDEQNKDVNAEDIEEPTINKLSAMVRNAFAKSSGKVNVAKSSGKVNGVGAVSLAGRSGASKPANNAAKEGTKKSNNKINKETNKETSRADVDFCRTSNDVGTDMSQVGKCTQPTTFPYTCTSVIEIESDEEDENGEDENGEDDDVIIIEKGSTVSSSNNADLIILDDGGCVNTTPSIILDDGGCVNTTTPSIPDVLEETPLPSTSDNIQAAEEEGDDDLNNTILHNNLSSVGSGDNNDEILAEENMDVSNAVAYDDQISHAVAYDDQISLAASDIDMESCPDLEGSFSDSLPLMENSSPGSSEEVCIVDEVIEKKTMIMSLLNIVDTEAQCKASNVKASNAIASPLTEHSFISVLAPFFPDSTNNNQSRREALPVVINLITKNRKKKKKNLNRPKKIVPQHIMMKILHNKRMQRDARRVAREKERAAQKETKIKEIKEEKKDEIKEEKEEETPQEPSPATTEETDNGRTLGIQTVSVFRIAIKDEQEALDSVKEEEV